MANGHLIILPEIRQVELKTKNCSVVLRAQWDVNAKNSGNFLTLIVEPSPRPASNTSANCSASSLVVIACSTSAKEDGDAVSVCHIDATGPTFEFLCTTIAHTSEKSFLKFILPVSDGYIVRSDFIEASLRGTSSFTLAKAFVTPGEHCTVASVHADEQGSAKHLFALLQSSVGVVATTSSETLQSLDDELQNRLSWPWTIPDPVKRTRVAMIGEKRKEAMCGEFYDAARGCGISMVILDNPGHWMEDDNGSGPRYREHFVPFSVSGHPLGELPERIVEAIRHLPYKVDGITTIQDVILPAVARAAEILGLPTLGPEAYRRGTDKFETRQLSRAPTAMRVESLETFGPQLEALSEPLRYPLIVKPTRGSGSEGITRVDHEADLFDALRFAFRALEKQHQVLGLEHGVAAVIIETYCEGPEVDVNMLLWNGELLHAEVADNFPCLGDSAKAKSKTFGCTGSLFPSALPQHEVEMLKRDVLAIVRTIGLHSGVIHAEAKVNNSSYEAPVDEIGVKPRSKPASDRCSTFLLEINTRPGGLPEPMCSIYTYGVDYFAAQLLHAIGDEARFRAIACGFREKPSCHYAWLPQAIDTTMSGRMPEDLGLEKLGLASSHVSHWHYWKGAEVVPPAQERPWPGLGFMIFKSLSSRQEVLQKIVTAKDRLRIDLD